MQIRDLYERGLALRKNLFGKDVEERMNRAGQFGEPLQQMINAYAYGDVWQRTALPNRTKSLAVLAMTAALNRPDEFRVHMKGAIANGCTAEEIQDLCLMVAIYCGVPAANEAHRIANEVLTAHGKGL